MIDPELCTACGTCQIVGRFDADYNLLDPAGLFLAVTSGGDCALRVASHGIGYLAVWDEAASLRGARINATGVILDPGGFPVVDRQGSWPFDLDWDGNHYVVAWINSDGDALVEGFHDSKLQDPSQIRLPGEDQDERVVGIHLDDSLPALSA